MDFWTRIKTHRLKIYKRAPIGIHHGIELYFGRQSRLKTARVVIRTSLILYTYDNKVIVRTGVVSEFTDASNSVIEQYEVELYAFEKLIIYE